MKIYCANFFETVKLMKNIRKILYLQYFVQIFKDKYFQYISIYHWYNVYQLHYF